MYVKQTVFLDSHEKKTKEHNGVLYVLDPLIMS